MTYIPEIFICGSMVPCKIGEMFIVDDLCDLSRPGIYARAIRESNWAEYMVGLLPNTAEQKAAAIELLKNPSTVDAYFYEVEVVEAFHSELLAPTEEDNSCNPT